MHVVTTPRDPFDSASGALRVHQIPAASDNLVWIAECTATRNAAIVDGPTAGEALEAIERLGLTLAAVWNTHTHGDHIGVNRDLARRGMLDGLEVAGFAGRRSEIPGLTHPVAEGDTVRLGNVTAQVWLTEGHIDGHISFLVEDVLFCGDTLFAGGCGYLFDGPPTKMYGSLMRLAELPGETRVCCAHEYTQDNLRFAWSVEPDNAALADRIRQVWALRGRGECSVPSTIEEERATNPFMRPGSATLQNAVAAALPDADLCSPSAVFAATRRLKDTKAYRALGDAPIEPVLRQGLAG